MGCGERYLTPGRGPTNKVEAETREFACRSRRLLLAVLARSPPGCASCRRLATSCGPKTPDLSTRNRKAETWSKPIIGSEDKTGREAPEGHRCGSEQIAAPDRWWTSGYRAHA